SNSFGMLNQKALINKITTQKKIKNFHTTKPIHSFFEILAYTNASDASKKADDNQDLLKQNNALLEKITEQNKENNALLRAIIQQNYLNAGYDRHHPTQYSSRSYDALLHLYDLLEKKYGIQSKID